MYKINSDYLFRIMIHGLFIGVKAHIRNDGSGSTPEWTIISQVEMRYEEAVQDVRNSRLVGCRYKYAENPHLGN